MILARDSISLLILNVNMLSFIDIIIDAFNIIFDINEYYLNIVLTSLYVSIIATFLTALIFIPLSAIIAMNSFIFKNILMIIINSLLALPPVVIGLCLYIIFSRVGVFGEYDLLYTLSVMIIAQIILIIPIIMSLTIENTYNTYIEYRDYLKSVHSTKLSSMITILWESRSYLIMNVLVSLGRLLSEVGAVIIVGGNIENLTRTMTTGIVLETSKGELSIALSLGITLLIISLVLNILIYFFRKTSHV